MLREKLVVKAAEQFVVVAEDDACDPKQAGTVAQKIADDPKNNVFIGHMCSGTTLAGSPIINKVNLPQVTLSSNPKITQNGWKNLFRPIANDNIQGKAGVAFVMRKFGAKKFALLNDKQAFGQGVTEVAKATIEKAGGSCEMLPRVNSAAAWKAKRKSAKGKPRLSNRTDNESAKMATGR